MNCMTSKLLDMISFLFYMEPKWTLCTYESFEHRQTKKKKELGKITDRWRGRWRRPSSSARMTQTVCYLSAFSLSYSFFFPSFSLNFWQVSTRHVRPGFSPLCLCSSCPPVSFSLTFSVLSPPLNVSVSPAADVESSPYSVSCHVWHSDASNTAALLKSDISTLSHEILVTNSYLMTNETLAHLLFLSRQNTFLWFIFSTLVTVQVCQRNL